MNMPDSADHDQNPEPAHLEERTPDEPDRTTALSRIVTAAAVNEITTRFAESLADLEAILTTALRTAFDHNRRMANAKTLAAVVPQIEQHQRGLLVGNHELAGLPGHEDQATLGNQLAAWREGLPSAQRAVFDASRHGVPQVAATLLRFATAGMPKLQKGAGKRRKRH